MFGQDALSLEDVYEEEEEEHFGGGAQPKQQREQRNGPGAQHAETSGRTDPPISMQLLLCIEAAAGLSGGAKAHRV